MKRILAQFTAQIVKIVVNVLLLLIAVYGSGWFLKRGVSVLVICSVYMASVIESLVRLLQQFETDQERLPQHDTIPLDIPEI